MTDRPNNPFSIKTPETMSAQEVVDLFVPMSELFDIEGTGHVFVHGHRGCGKSMMFRLLAPDCQVIRRETSIELLPYYGVYLSIKATDLNIPEFDRLEGQVAGYVLSEHTLVGYLASKTVQSLIENISTQIEKEDKIEELRRFCKITIFEALKLIGWLGDDSAALEATSAKDLLVRILNVINSIHVQTISYLKRLSFIQDIPPFEGPLLGFQDFLLPLLRGLRTLSFMPSGPIYLLIDDADNLTFQQTQVLNTWVSYRTNADLCLKISTQLSYKTHLLTTGRQRIESPHDYSEINISDVYTGRAKDRYPQWVEDIVGRRLLLFDITATPKEFFPEDQEQEEEIKKIAAEYESLWTPTGSGANRARDYAYRNARPEYIKRLAGTSKQGHTYRYAGFEQLVHISSGIVRYFLDPASQMFSEEKKKSSDGTVNVISPAIQNKVTRETSDQIMLNDFDELIEDIDKSADRDPDVVQKMKKLRNLIHTLGGMFYQILVSDRTERRVFSFAISDDADPEVREILRLGVRYGYFYESSIGTKEGMGRTRLYVLTRRLAPFFKLDPTGFSGYKFVTNSFLRSALEKPKRTQNQLKRLGVDAVIANDQQSFEFDEDQDES
jgi:hypothetical protein